MSLFFRESQWVLLVLAVSILVAACHGPIWPSRSMTVDLKNSGASAIEVKEVIEARLSEKGFVDLGDNGKDKIQGTKTSFTFEGPDDLLVFIEIDRVGEVPIRVSQDRKSFDTDAQRLFDDLAAAVERRWPNSVWRDPVPGS